MSRQTVVANNLRSIVEEFVARLVAAVEADTSQRVRAAVLNALENGATPRRRGRPPKNGFAFLIPSAPAKPRSKQLCPVPGCKNPAAPVFGMVCAKHKDVPEADIKKYREQRRAAKDKSGGKDKAAAKPA
jgi:hypothetical protein